MSEARIDDEVLALRAGFAEPLESRVVNSAIAAFVRSLTFNDIRQRELKMVQARATVELLEREVGEKRDDVLLLCVLKLHYGGKVISSAATKVATRKGLDGWIKKEAIDLANLICQSKSFKAVHLERLRRVHAAVARAGSEKSDTRSEKSDNDNANISA